MESTFLISVVALVVCCFSSVWTLELAPYSLPGRLYPSKKRITVSGTFDGAVMAQMIQIAHSEYIKGIGVFSPGLYRCGNPDGDEASYVELCTRLSSLPEDQQYTVDQVVTELHTYDSTRVIDSLENMRYVKLYVYVTLRNEFYTPEQQLNVVALYERYLASPYLIYTRVQDESVWLRAINTKEKQYCPYEPQADSTVSHNCTDLSVVAEALGFILGGSNYASYINPFYPYLHPVYLGPLRSFNQKEFTHDLVNHGLDDVGYYYVPSYCEKRGYSNKYGYGQNSYGAPCEVHVYFHGCNQGREFLGTSHVIEGNFLEVAELNYIIMLFPQALSSEDNTGGCWDIFGNSGADYATKSGVQITAVWRMLEKLLYLMPEKTTYYRAGTGRSSSSTSSSRNNYYGFMNAQNKMGH